MYLSESQLELIQLIGDAGQVDLLSARISTVSSLTARGLADVVYAKRPGQITYVELTDLGMAVADHIDDFYKLPKYKDVLAKTHLAKGVMRKVARANRAS